MAFQVDVNKNIDSIEDKVIGNFTKRQIFLFPLGAIVGISFYYLTKIILPTDIAFILMMVTGMPFFIFATYKRDDGQYLEAYIKDILSYLKRPKVYTYETQNIYGYLQNRIYRKNVLKISNKNVHQFLKMDRSLKSKLFRLFKRDI